MGEQAGKRVSLVLGSGGARGLAHIGIIQRIEEQGYRIESISGASMGALVGVSTRPASSGPSATGPMP